MYQSILKPDVLGYNTTSLAGQSEGWYVLIFGPKKLADIETFNVVLKKGARGVKACQDGLEHFFSMFARLTEGGVV